MNLVPLALNISRIYEIATAGGHTVKLIKPNGGPENVTDFDLRILGDFYGFYLAFGLTPSNPDIIVEVAYSPDDLLRVLSPREGEETLNDINSRAAVVDRSTVDTKLDKVSTSLLKSAIEKLELGINDVIKIRNVAITIAALAGSKTIRVEHIAEAVQYRSVRP